MKMMTSDDNLALIGVTVGWLTVGAVVTWVIYSVYAFGPKRTFVLAPRMSAFGGKADIIWSKLSASRGPDDTFEQ
jgi:hypothetical protein